MCLFKSGVPQPFDKKQRQHFNSEEVHIRVELNLGEASATPGM